MTAIDSKLIIDEKKAINTIVAALKNYFIKNNIKKGIIGLSGGVDSSLVAFLAVKALGKENVVGLIMPYKTNKPEDVNDAENVAQILGITYKKIEITPIVDRIKDVLEISDKIPLGNVTARIRMIALYNEAWHQKGIVLGTGNKTELLVGYFTKYGDGGVDILPIGDLYKTQVWKVAEAIGVPSKIVTKTPTAGLWTGQTDEDELGVEYKALDKILVGLFELKMSCNELASELEISEEIIKKIEKKVAESEHKRRVPQIIKVQQKD